MTEFVGEGREVCVTAATLSENRNTSRCEERGAQNLNVTAAFSASK